MPDWDWFDEYERIAYLTKDNDRIRLAGFHREAYGYRESDPDLALNLLKEGRRLAERLREPWWVLYYDQQQVHALLHFKQDYRDVLDLAIRNTLQVRKPEYADFPRRLMIHGDLVSAYLGIDPLGHASAIEQALTFLGEQIPSEGDDQYLWLGSQRQFALERADYDQAAVWTQRSIALASDDANRTRACHFLVFAYSGLAEIAFHRRDDRALEESTLIGEELAGIVGHQVERAGFWLWQALLSRRRGAEETARQLHSRAVVRLQRLGMLPDQSYRDAECAYHEEARDLERSLEVREQEWVSIRNRGRVAYETAVLLKRARLKSQLSLLTEDDLEHLRQSASRLKQPAKTLEQIDRLARGEAP